MYHNIFSYHSVVTRPGPPPRSQTHQCSMRQRNSSLKSGCFNKKTRLSPRNRLQQYILDVHMPHLQTTWTYTWVLIYPHKVSNHVHTKHLPVTPTLGSWELELCGIRWQWTAPFAGGKLSWWGPNHVKRSMGFQMPNDNPQPPNIAPPPPEVLKSRPNIPPPGVH